MWYTTDDPDSAWHHRKPWLSLTFSSICLGSYIDWYVTYNEYTQVNNSLQPLAICKHPIHYDDSLFVESEKRQCHLYV